MNLFSKNFVRSTRLIKLTALFVIATAALVPTAYVLAQSGNPQETTNPSSSLFHLIICQGPAEINDPATHGNDPSFHKDLNFIACDFNGLMRQIQHVIDIMLVLGVFAALAGLTYGGFLYITGEQSKISQAKEIFRKIAIGFILMLSAWFIVFQILDWLVRNDAVKNLIGH